MLTEPDPFPPSGGRTGRHVVTAQPTLTRFGAGPAAFGGAVLGFIGLIWVLLLRSGAWGPLPGVVGAVMIAAAVAMLLWAVLVRRRGVVELLTGWAHPTLEISPWPLDLGTEVTVVYRRRPRRGGMPARLPEVTGRLVCTEWVRYTVGTDTRTATDDVVTLTSTVPGRVVGPEVMAVFTVGVPVDAGGPTLTLRHNRVSWRLEHQLGEPFGPRTRTSVEVAVRSVLDRDVATGERRPTAAGP